MVAEIFFLTGLFPDNKQEEIIENSKGVIQYAADRLQKNIAKGLSHHFNSVHLINSIYIGSYPKFYKKIEIKSENFTNVADSQNFDVGFINLPVLKNFSRFFNVKKILQDKLDKKGTNVILIYAMHTAFIKAAVEQKKHFDDVKIILIVPDLPQYMGDIFNPVLRKIKNLDVNYQAKLLKHVDGYIVLSKYMIDELPVGKKPWVVLEGIYDNDVAEEKIEKSQNEFILLYSGTLAKRYGISELLQSFNAIEQPQIKLWICGDGDGRQDVESAARNDARINYFGQVKPSQVKKMQAQAHALINPRTPDADYTKFSFPSKTMEYLASGAPAIMYPLAGIPNEYNDYFFSVENKENGLTEKIMEVYHLSQNERDEFSQKAKQFITENKNSIIQTQKIVDLLKKIT